MEVFRIMSLFCTLIMLFAAWGMTEAQDKSLDQHGDHGGHSIGSHSS